MSFALVRRGLGMCVILAVVAGCSKKSEVKTENRLFGDMTPSEREQIQEAFTKAGLQGDIVSIEPKSDHWQVDFNVAKIGKDGKRKRALPTPPDTYKVSKSGKVTKL